MREATPEEVRAGIEATKATNERRLDAVSFARLSRALRHEGTTHAHPGKLNFRTREALYRQEPLLQRGIKKHTGDLVKHGFKVVTPDGDEHEQNDLVQAWMKDQFIEALIQDALISAHLHGDGFVEIEWDDGGNASDPAQKGSIPTAVHVIDPATVRFMDGKDSTGNTVTFLVQDVFGGNPVSLHPDRYHQFIFTRLPGHKHGVPTVEVAYHAAISKVKGDQGIGEVLYHSGTPKVHAQVKDGQPAELDLVAKMLNDPDFVRGYVWNDRLTMTQLNPIAADPTGFYDVLEASIAAAIGIPVMLLKGAQAGAVTGSETNLADYWSDLLQGKVTVLEPFFTRIVGAILRLEPSAYDFQWLDPPVDPKQRALTVRDQAAAMSLLKDAGITKEAAARLVGLDVTDEDFAEEPDPGMLPPLTEPGAAPAPAKRPIAPQEGQGGPQAGKPSIGATKVPPTPRKAA